jgi:hypothetical protein
MVAHTSTIYHRQSTVYKMRTLALLPLLLVLACAERGDIPPPPEIGLEALENPQDAWWNRMMEHCGHAYPGGLTLEPEGDEMLRGDELLVVHFRECSHDELRLPFHIEREPGVWDRSRTWIFTRHEHGLELRHDHRHEDGTPEETTFYGGFTVDEGTPIRQVFIFTDYDEYDPAGPHRGWRVDIEPNTRYTYGTFRGDDWRWRVDFDSYETRRTWPASPNRRSTSPVGEGLVGRVNRCDSSVSEKQGARGRQ